MFKHADGKVRWGVVVTSIVTFISIAAIASGWKFGLDAYAAVKEVPALKEKQAETDAKYLALKDTMAEMNAKLSQLQVQLDIVIPLLREHHQ